jgi:hypothetical protein
MVLFNLQTKQYIEGHTFSYELRPFPLFLQEKMSWLFWIQRCTG